MIVRTLAEVFNTEAHVKGESFESRRILLAKHRLGYSFHDTLVKKGTVQRLQYKNHVEANYCIEGEGELEEAKTGRRWPLKPGTMYVLDNHEEHLIHATKSNLRFICIFSPALTGNEKHDSDGSYAVSDDDSAN